MKSILHHKPPEIIVVSGLDGSGKSTSAQNAAAALSKEYIDRQISVLDTDGGTTYLGGLAVKVAGFVSRCYGLSQMNGPLHTAGTVAYTACRRSLDARHRAGLEGDDVVISVRDVARVDPAVYAPEICSVIFKRMSIGRRFDIFDKTTLLPPADSIIRMRAEVSEVMGSIGLRAVVDPHENPESLKRLDIDLDSANQLHRHRFGTTLHDVSALKGDKTVDDLAALLESAVSDRRSLSRS